jgi:hypothetical protein
MDGIKRLSGPVSMHTFVAPNNKTVHILGDYHFSVDNTCNSCDEVSCMDLVTFIQKHVEMYEGSSNKSFDMFIEIPYLSKNREKRKKVIEFTDKLLLKEHTWSYQLLESFGAEQHKIGMISAVYNKFRNRFVDHADRNDIRFHYTDMRQDPVVLAVLLPVFFNGRMVEEAVQNTLVRFDSLEKLVKTLGCFLYSKDFLKDLHEVLPNVNSRYAQDCKAVLEAF